MGHDKKVKIVLIDDHTLFREGLRRVLECEKTFQVVAEGADGDVAMELIDKYNPDIVLMDINMPKKDGLGVTKQIVSYFPNTNVIILSIHNEDAFVTQALINGAKGYLLKDMDAESLIGAIKAVYNGGLYLHPKITSNIVQEYQRFIKESELISKYEIDRQRPYHLLTKREYDVLQLLAEGKSNRDIATMLAIGEKTVKNHVSNILRKLNVNDRTQAVITAIRNGWVTITINDSFSII